MENNLKRYWDIPALLFLAIALWVSVSRLVATDWTQNLDVTELMVMTSFTLGIFLGKSRFRSGTARWFAFVYTVLIVPYQLAGTIDAQRPWLERYMSLGIRISHILYALFNNLPIKDNIFFLSIMGLLYWLLAMISGYMLVRYGRPWITCLMAGVVLLIIDQYSYYIHFRDRYTVIYFICLLSLVGRVYFLKSHEEWVRKGITVDSETGFSLGKVMLGAGIIIILLSWNLPVFANAINSDSYFRAKVADTFSDIRNRLTNAMAGLRNPVVFVNDYYGDTLNLGTGAAQGNQAIFRVKINPVVPYQEPLRYYWHGTSWNTFDGREWTNTLETRKTVLPKEWPVDSQPAPGRDQVNLTYDILASSIQKVYIPDIPLYVNRAVETIGAFQGRGATRSFDTVSMLAIPVLRPGDTVYAKADVSAPTVVDLSTASADYPDWVKTYYLQLPPGFSTQVSQLAQDITHGLPTNYDKARAITDYLRKNIQYEKFVAAPPAGRDLIEWFLFDYKKGFCNYYASAEVLMLRSVGIPARMATGYAEGRFNQVEKFYEVLAKDSHAWPEVYFTGFGWVPFEPTAAQPAYNLPTGNNGTGNQDQNNLDPRGLHNGRNEGEPYLSAEDPKNLPKSPTATGFTIYSWIGLALIILFVVFGGFLVWKRPKFQLPSIPVLIEERYHKRGDDAPRVIQRWADYSRSLPIERFFLTVNWMIWVLRLELRGGETPAERMSLVMREIPDVKDSGNILLSEYQRAMFSQHPYDVKIAQKAYWQLWLGVVQSIRDRIAAFFRRFI
jgi:transglutaminase-like putative cysteine protease